MKNAFYSKTAAWGLISIVLCVLLAALFLFLSVELAAPGQASPDQHYAGRPSILALLWEYPLATL